MEESVEDSVGETPVVGDGPFRAKLDDERVQLLEQIEVIESAGFDDNFADSGQVAAEQGENRVLAGELREQLADVEAALQKLDDGSYGRCEVCGEPIGEARLEAMPAARFCMQHAG